MLWRNAKTVLPNFFGQEALLALKIFMEPQSIKIHMVKIKYCGAHSCVSKMEGISQEHLIVCSGNEFIVLK